MASLNQTPARAVLQYLIRRVDSWIIAEILNIHLRKQQDFYDTVSVVLKSEEALNCEYGSECMKNYNYFWRLILQQVLSTVI